MSNQYIIKNKFGFKNFKNKSVNFEIIKIKLIRC